MRVKEIHIDHWRNLRDVHIVPPEDAPLICLVGENGTGKSSILDLIAEVGGLIGAPAFVSARTPRRLAFTGAYRIDVVVDIRPFDYTQTPPRYVFNPLPDDFQEQLAGWDHRTFHIHLETDTVPMVTAGGWDSVERSAYPLQLWRGSLQDKIVNRTCLLLGPDRFYPASAADPGTSLEPGHQSGSSQLERMALELVRSLLFEHQQVHSAWVKDVLETLHDGGTVSGPGPAAASPPRFPGLDELLPHLGSPQTDPDRRDIVFGAPPDGIPLSALSSGEMDVLVTALYLQRFADSTNLILIDEPELHLHPGLVVARLAYLRDSNPGGQTWIATHSQEAIGVAGDESTIVLNRSPNDHLVHGARPRSEQGVEGLLAAAMGWPSVPSELTRFVFIENDPVSPRRGRIPRLVGQADTQFVPSGGHKEVVARTKHVADTARFVQRLHTWRIGGIVDGDYMDQQERSAFMKSIRWSTCSIATRRRTCSSTQRPSPTSWC